MHTSTPNFDLELLINTLAEQGYVIVDDFLDPPHINALAAEARQRWANGTLANARTGKQAINNQAIRGDHIAWLDETSEHPSITAYYAQIKHLQTALNQYLFMNLHEIETHLALYPLGAGYQKHLDQFNHGHTTQPQARQLSSILYLNESWQADDGGALRLYLSEETYQDILPVGGRLVLFLSAKFWHEVLPAKRERISLTGWFRTRDQQLI
ncbi:MAG TPA: 2OG-Fe(II) oxygenase [Methylophilus sp.]